LRARGAVRDFVLPFEGNVQIVNSQRLRFYLLAEFQIFKFPASMKLIAHAEMLTSQRGGALRESFQARRPEVLSDAPSLTERHKGCNAIVV
jgi:hypothetical protein